MGGARRRAPGMLVALALAAVALAGLAPAASALLPLGAKPLAGSPPKITQQPTSVSAEVGHSASFTATASGTPTPTVQWERSTDGGATFSPISGANSTTYTIAATAVSENGYQFRAVFHNEAGEAVSKAATLTVLQIPEITEQPQSQFVKEGEFLDFSAAATGSPPPTVQWQKSINGGTSFKDITGATSTTLHYGPVQNTENNVEIRAVFTNAAGKTNTKAAIITVAVAPKVTQQPANQTVMAGGTATFEANGTGTPPPSLQWEVSPDGGATWEPIPEATFPVLRVMNATEEMGGWEYRARFSNIGGTTFSNAATLTVQTAPAVTKQPVGATILVGESASFEATAKGVPAPTVQWDSSTDGGTTWNPVGGATSTKLTVGPASLGQNGTEYRAAFSNVAGMTFSHPALLTVAAANYSAYGWGANARGEVGIGSNEEKITGPTQIPGLSFLTAVSSGAHHSLALFANGTVDAWGANLRGQLGDPGVEGPIRSPIAVGKLGGGVKAIAAGGQFSLALMRNGTVEAWGDNDSGQLGNGSTAAESESPVLVHGLSGVVAIAAGEEQALALLSNGTVMAWGNNERGQLGTGTKTNANEPTEVKGLTGVKAIAAGGQFSLALLEGGTVKAWGDDRHDQLGNAAVLEEHEGTLEEREEGAFSRLPVQVEGLSGVSAIAAGTSHSLALLEGGTVEAWGDDREGELGNGVERPASDTPEEVAGLTQVTRISAGNQESVALLESGSLMAWGANGSGQLGTGHTGSPSLLPTAVQTLADAVGVSAGGTHVLAFGASAPAVTAVEPSAGPLAGGNTVTITGQGFAGATAVHFGSAAATEVVVQSPTTVTATAPAGTGTVDVTVTGPTGTSTKNVSDRYTYSSPPAISKLSAKTGAATGGTGVTITGSGFTHVSGVSFGGVPAASFTVLSATSIEAVAPVSIAGTVDVRVTTAGGPSATSSKDHFKYTPVVEGVSPPNGPVAGGTVVTVTGVGFAPGTGITTFKFGKAKAAIVECESQTSCTVTTPKSKVLGAVAVVATVAKAKGTAAPGQFTYE